MKTTIELLDAALDKRGLSERALCKELGVSAANLAVARRRGSLSPMVAGQLAEMLNLNVEHWMAVSVVESAPRSRVTDRLRKVLHAIAYQSGLLRKRRPLSATPDGQAHAKQFRA